MRSKILEGECAKIEAGLFRLCLGLNFAFMDKSVRQAFSPKSYQRIIRSLREPLTLSEAGEATLEVYEDHVSNFLVAHSGVYAEC